MSTFLNTVVVVLVALIVIGAAVLLGDALYGIFNASLCAALVENTP